MLTSASTFAMAILLSCGMVNPVMAGCTITAGDDPQFPLKGTVDGSTAKCDQVYACVGAVIEGCDTVECHGHNACGGATITGADKVDCEGSTACKDATIEGADKVDCKGSQVCTSTTFKGCDKIECDGFGACQDVYIEEGVVTCRSTGSCTQHPEHQEGNPDCVICVTDDSCFVSGVYLPKDSYGECPKDSMAGGDPHFMRWNGKWFDFHAQCDLVLLQNPDFQDGLGMVIHIRTKARGEYSYIESAAVKIGNEDVVEVSSFGQYSVNGVTDAMLPFMMADKFLLTHQQVDTKQHQFNIQLGQDSEHQHLIVNTFKDMVTVKISNATAVNFGSSVGLMGQFGTGAMVGRPSHHAGSTTMMEDDGNAFGQAWQVLDSEPKLFLFQDSHPQYPTACVFPDPKKEGRRLGEAAVAKSDAEEACDQWTGETKEMCIFDVMATGDLEVADTFGAY